MKVTIASVALLAAASPGLATNFFASCDADSVTVSDNTLTAKCHSITGKLTCSKLDLNTCLKNSYGTLQADPSGAGPHLSECYNCSNDQTTSGVLLDSKSVIHCQCNPHTGASKDSWPVAIFDLNAVVDNNNGRLECFGHRAENC